MNVHLRRRTGFTLIELLVVAAVLALLATICFGAFTRAREKGRAATCASDLRQLGLAMQSYVQDSDGHFPSVWIGYPLYDNPTDWVQVLEPYVKDSAILRCPTSQVDKERRDTDYEYNMGRLSDVTYRAGKGGLIKMSAGKHEARMQNPATTRLLWDLHWQVGYPPDDGYYVYADENGSPNLHAGGANFSFLDGHVKWLSLQQQDEMGRDNARQREQQQQQEAPDEISAGASFSARPKPRGAWPWLA